MSVSVAAIGAAPSECLDAVNFIATSRARP